MAFCSNQTASFTTGDLRASFGTAERQSVLPATALADSSRDANGILTAAALKTLVDGLISQGRIPQVPAPANTTKEALASFAVKDRAFNDTLRAEYCFYDSRYRYALQQMISKLQAGYNASDANLTAVLRSYVEATQSLNQKLNDLTQIAGEIAKRRLQQSTANNQDIQRLSADMNAKAAALRKQSEILNSQQGAANLYKEMVSYSKEKVKSTDNLLSLYSALNVVAIGMLFYIYKSM
jgi:hypothetical protein